MPFQQQINNFFCDFMSYTLLNLIEKKTNVSLARENNERMNKLIQSKDAVWKPCRLKT